MTEPIVPDPLADGIVSGSVDPATLPAELRGVAEVFAAAHQPPTEGELVGMASAVGAFQAAVTTPVPSADPVPPRSVVTMFSTRIPKRAAVIVAATVLMAGTAAAAAGGASPFAGASRPEILDLPIPGDETSTTETTVEGETTTTAGDTTTSTDDSTTTTTESSDTSTTEAAATESTYPGRDFGHCTAWGVGAPKSTDIPGFRSLGESAEAAGLTVEEYCELVLAAHDGDDVDDDADDDESTSTSTDDETTSARTPGNGKGGDHGRGNGNGKGKP
ncbi:MAG: hypothetical protein RL238_2826 [Actinomycetota bacterium]